LVLINETLELIRLMGENLRNDSKVMVDASLALVRIEAVAGVLAERAYEKAREGGLEEAVKTSKSITKAHKGCY
jgi:predicted transcriptional regulator